MTDVRDGVPAAGRSMAVERGALERQVVGALKNTIDTHGPIGRGEVASAAKRITCQVMAYLRDAA